MKFLIPSIIFCLFSSYSIAQNVGIGVTTPQERLHVDSNMKIGGNIWSADSDDRVLKFGDGDFVSIGEVEADDFMKLSARKIILSPSVGVTNPFVQILGSVSVIDGSEGQGKVLTSDVNGNASWQPLANTNSGFGANITTTVPVATSQLLSWDNESYDDASDLSGSFFTATKTGLYHFDATVTFSLGTVTASSASVGIIASLPGPKEKYSYLPVSSANNGSRVTVSLGFQLKLVAGETVSISAVQNTGASQNVIAEVSAGKEATSFSGYRIY